MKNWYSIKNLANETLNISIHDEIGVWGISAAEFLKDLRQHATAQTINLSIHSPGGSLLDGLAIYNALAAHPAHIIGKVEGLAGSAASFILMAADQIEMPENSFIMIHNTQGQAFGESQDLRYMADVMDKMTNMIVGIYQKRTGAEEAVIVEMMNSATWIPADQALELGFTDIITERIELAAKATAFSKYFKTMPFNTAPLDVGEINTIKQFEKWLRDSANLSRSQATALTSKAKVIFQGEPEPLPNDQIQKLSNALARIKVPGSLNAS